MCFVKTRANEEIMCTCQKLLPLSIVKHIYLINVFFVIGQKLHEKILH